MGNFRKALFLDRDGVINRDTGYTYQKKDLSLVEGIVPLCLAAQEKGYLLIVITNQSGIARGMYTVEQMHSFHQHLSAVLSSEGVILQAFYYCPHHPSYTGTCLCRKPRTLLLDKAKAKYQLAATESWMIGDKERDIQAGQQAGCKTILYSPPIKSRADYQIEKLQEAISLL